MDALTGALVAWDRHAFHAVNSGLACPFLDWVMPIITDLGLGHVQAIVLVGVAAIVGLRMPAQGSAGILDSETSAHTPLRRKLWTGIVANRAWVVTAIVAMLLTGTAVQILKRIDRKRPSWFYVHERRAGRSLDTRVHTIKGRRPLRVNGFPSGHTATTASLAVVLSLTLPNRRSRRAAAIAMGALTGLVALSRVYMADHWPSDVLAGAALGALAGWMVSRAVSSRHDAARPQGGEAPMPQSESNRP